MKKECYVALCKSNDVIVTKNEMFCLKCGSRRKLNPAEKEMVRLGMTKEEYCQLLSSRRRQISNLNVGEEVQIEMSNKFVSRRI